jgi:hypothetical protein
MTLSNEERFQQAAGAARAIVRQCLNHAERSSAKLPQRIDRASASSAHGRDVTALEDGKYTTAFRQRVEMVQSNCNGLVSQLRGLDVLMQHDTFLPQAGVSVVRSIAEISASTSWLLRSEVSVEDRAVRSYATLFRSLDKAILGTIKSDSSRFTAFRERLVDQVEKEGARVVRKTRDGVQTPEVLQVTIRKAHAKVDFRYSHRIVQEIPKMGTLYSAMSGVVHGEQMHLSTTFETPDALARLIGRVAQWSVQAWSRAVHEWVGVSHGSFLSREDLRRLLASTPAEYIEQFGPVDLDV